MHPQSATKESMKSGAAANDMPGAVGNRYLLNEKFPPSNVGLSDYNSACFKQVFDFTQRTHAEAIVCAAAVGHRAGISNPAGLRRIAQCHAR